MVKNDGMNINWKAVWILIALMILAAMLHHGIRWLDSRHTPPKHSAMIVEDSRPTIWERRKTRASTWKPELQFVSVRF